MHEVFRVLKLDDLSDVAVYDQLKASVDKSICKVRNDYERLEFTSVINNLPTLKNINQRVEDLG